MSTSAQQPEPQVPEDGRPDDAPSQEDGQESGQLSEVASRKGAGVVEPGDAVAGHPTDGNVQEGAAGPDARTGNEDPDDPEAVVDELDIDPEAVVDELDPDPEVIVDGEDDEYPRVRDEEEDRA